MNGFVIFSGNYALTSLNGWRDLWNAHVWTKEEVVSILEESRNWDFRPTHIQRGSDEGNRIEVYGEIREL